MNLIITESRLTDLRERSQQRCFNESDSHGESHLINQRKKSQQRCRNESDSQREARLTDLRERSQERRANESDSQRESHLLTIRETAQERRASESEEQRAKQNQRMRKHRRELLANQAPPTPSPENVRQQELAKKDLENFQKEIQLSLTSICCTCEHLCYPKGVSMVDVSEVHDVLQQRYHASINDTQLSALLPIEDVDGSVYVCTRCIAFIKKGKIPLFATINHMHVDKIPPELSHLKTMEQRLISRVQAI
uniref:Uncharacterized protein n=1 Tax=Amphimedon queenslandica TaxID=400682 RepID=A0A1X7T8T7_AMPQE